MHPRTKNNLEAFGLDHELENMKGLVLTDPMDYFGFQKLIKSCSFVLTDSGGIQEETTFRRVPCLTLRRNTERPSTTDIRSNTLVPFDTTVVKGYIDSIEEGSYDIGEVPPYWDGKATERIFNRLQERISG